MHVSVAGYGPGERGRTCPCSAAAVATRLYVIACRTVGGRDRDVAYKRLPHRGIVMPGLHPFLVRPPGSRGDRAGARGGRAERAGLPRDLPLSTSARIRRCSPPSESRAPPSRRPSAGASGSSSRCRGACSASCDHEPGGAPLGGARGGGRAPPAACSSGADPARGGGRRPRPGTRRPSGGPRDLPGSSTTWTRWSGMGMIGGAGPPNAADFQILASVRVLLEFEALRHLPRVARARRPRVSCTPTGRGDPVLPDPASCARGPGHRGHQPVGATLRSSASDQMSPALNGSPCRRGDHPGLLSSSPSSYPAAQPA